MAYSYENFQRRRERVRFKLKARNINNKLRLSIFRSNQNIYAQLIDDQAQKTIISASSLEKEYRSSLETGGNCKAASWVGNMLAKRALQNGIREAVFDRGGYLFHGRVKALAEAARNAGLSF